MLGLEKGTNLKADLSGGSPTLAYIRPDLICHLYFLVCLSDSLLSFSVLHFQVATLFLNARALF